MSIESLGVVVLVMLFIDLVIGVFSLVNIYGIQDTVRRIKNELDKFVSDSSERYYTILENLSEINSELREGEFDIELEMEEDSPCECSREDCELCESFVCDERDIHLISKEQWTFDVLETSHYELKYYPNSDRVVYIYNTFDDTEEVEIENVAECIGDGLRFFGLRSGDENVVYVRNNKFKADFKIEKVVN